LPAYPARRWRRLLFERVPRPANTRAAKCWFRRGVRPRTLP